MGTPEENLKTQQETLMYPAILVNGFVGVLDRGIVRLTLSEGAPSCQPVNRISVAMCLADAEILLGLLEELRRVGNEHKAVPAVVAPSTGSKH